MTADSAEGKAEDTAVDNVIVLLTDRMNIATLRSYGNSMVDSDGFDRLCLESVLFDQYYAAGTDLKLLYRNLLGSSSPVPGNGTVSDAPLSLPERMRKAGRRPILLTDHAELADWPLARLFESVVVLAPDHPTQLADTIEDTHFIHCFEEAAALVQSFQEPFFLWCHFRGWESPWDFPLELRAEQRQDEDDPEAYPGIAPPFFQDESKKNGRYLIRALPDYADSVLAVSEAYLAGMTVWDNGLDGFCDFLRTETLLDRTLLVVVGGRGFPLGEHGRVGFPNEETGSLPPALFYNEDYHMPLLMRFPNAKYASVRVPGLVGSADLGPTILAALGESTLRPEQDDLNSGQSLFPLITEEEEQVHNHLLLHAASEPSRSSLLSDQALVSPDSLLIRRKNGETEYFVLPDDRFNVNNVADRCQEEVQQLIAECLTENSL